jgi:preprotein translocase subunit YajC
MDLQFLPLLILAALAFLMIMNTRRQKRAVADAQRLQNSLACGDRVVTTSGLHATVVASTEETTVELEIAPGVHTKWLRAAIREKITTGDEGESDEPAAASAPLAAPLDGRTRTDNP